MTATIYSIAMVLIILCIPRTEPLGTAENARVQVVELAEAITDYEYDVTHPYKHVVAYKMDTFLEIGQSASLLSRKKVAGGLVSRNMIAVPFLENRQVGHAAL